MEPFIIYHGTSLYYADHIAEVGLDGRFPDHLYTEMSKYKSIAIRAKYPRFDAYYHLFDRRQKNIREESEVEISFTKSLNVVRDFTGPRRGGEGPSSYYTAICSVSDDAVGPLRERLARVCQYPGLVLAIDVNEFNDDFWWPFPKPTPNTTDDYEITVHRKIPPEKLYILSKDKTKKVKLLSPEGLNDLWTRLIDAEKSFTPPPPVPDQKAKLFSPDRLNKDLHFSFEQHRELAKYQLNFAEEERPDPSGMRVMTKAISLIPEYNRDYEFFMRSDKDAENRPVYDLRIMPKFEHASTVEEPTRESEPTDSEVCRMVSQYHQVYLSDHPVIGTQLLNNVTIKGRSHQVFKRHFPPPGSRRIDC